MNALNSAKVRDGVRPSWPDKKRVSRVLAAGALLLGLLGVTFVGGWVVANESGLGRAGGSDETQVIEVPVVDVLGADKVMPDVRGLDPDTASQVIADAGIDVGTVHVEERPAAGQPGVVLEQSPAFGGVVTAGVSLVVSAPAEVPDVIGANINDATVRLSLLGASVERVATYDPDSPMNTVLAIEPAVGSDMPSSVKVTLNVAPSALPLSSIDRESGRCRTESSFLMAGVNYANGVVCAPHASDSTSWLIAGAADRIFGSVGLLDSEETSAAAKVQVLLDGKVVQEFDVVWGTSQKFDLRASGALKLSIVVTSESEEMSRVGLGDVTLEGEPSAIQRLREVS